MINQTAFKIFGIKIKWYGLSYVFAFFLCDKLISYYIIKYKNLEIDLEEKDKLITYIILGVLIGGRIGEFLFYRSTMFTLEIFNIRNGGMSFHGGLIGVIIVILIYSKLYKRDPIRIGDLIVLSAPIGLFLGRIANHINQEILGINYWIFHKNIALFEGFFEGFLLFFILNYMKTFKKKGRNVSYFMFFYSFFRFFLEFFKYTPKIFGINVGQILCVPMFLSFYYFYKKDNSQLN